MQIYVIQKGDTLYNIANLYGTTVHKLAEANVLEVQENLVVGESIVIPIQGQFYFTQPGDTLHMIASRFGLSDTELAQINHIPINGVLEVGHRLYIPAQPKTPITTCAYIQPTGNTVSEILVNAAKKHTPQLTYLALFNYTINRDGTLNPPLLDHFRQITTNNQAYLMMPITTLESGNFSPELGRLILTDDALQQTLLDNIISTALRGGYHDVHFDFEFLPPDTREAYNAFLRKAREKCHQNGLMLSTALAPKTSANQTGTLYGAHDYQIHGEICDMVVLMTYDWGNPMSPPMAISPINQVRKVIEFAISVIPRNKILMGQNLYGYDWTLPFVKNGELAKALSPQQAITLAREKQAAIQYNELAQAPFYRYYNPNGVEHEVWFEDARSIQAKFDLVQDTQILGIAYWKLGLAFPQNWLLLGDMFTIRKSG